jgi:hypothetical protein
MNVKIFGGMCILSPFIMTYFVCVWVNVQFIASFRWKNNIKMDLREGGGCCECGDELSCSIKCGEFLE